MALGRVSGGGGRVIPVLVAEGREDLRRVLVMRLELEPDIRVVATVSRVEEAIELARRHRPEVVIADIGVLLAGPTGWPASLGMASPSSRLIVLAVEEDAPTRRVAAAAGAAAVISALDNPDRLLEAVRDGQGERS